MLVLSQTLTEKVQPIVTSYNDESDLEIRMKKVGGMKYSNGEVSIYQNEDKITEFYLTPFPYVQSDQTRCYKNLLHNRIELVLPIELYSSDLIQAVHTYLQKHHPTLCNSNQTSVTCDVSLLPINSLRLVQRDQLIQKYTIDDHWYRNHFIHQSMKFLIYLSNRTLCDQLVKTMIQHGRLEDFQFQYSLDDRPIIKNFLVPMEEHIHETILAKEIRAQFPRAETVLLTGTHFNELISQITDHLIAKLRLQNGFDSLENVNTVKKVLQQYLSTQQVCTKFHSFLSFSS